MKNEIITVESKTIKIDSLHMKQNVAYYFRYLNEGYMAIKENTTIKIYAVIDEEVSD